MDVIQSAEKRLGGYKLFRFHIHQVIFAHFSMFVGMGIELKERIAILGVKLDVRLIVLTIFLAIIALEDQPPLLIFV